METRIIRQHSAQKSDINYRFATIEDTLCLSILLQQVYTHTYAKEGIGPHLTNFMHELFGVDKISTKIQKNKHSYFVATYKGNLVAVAEIIYKAACPIGKLISPELSKLYVFEHFTGMGIGYQLLKKVEQHLLAEQYQELWLWVYAYNDRAVAFYERQNYTSLGHAFLEIDAIRYENKVLHKKLV